ncbi:mitochondrial coenzyme A transporter SLC25A42 [Brachionus plicatilis]|uniref:Mitochondrial coenzyme A transporter SLC25A42 n=1 Tax=Brachionus plicatilis TaxID=10195 RepID=A0A3M7PQD6_BRAPC|nr:mitochondrial coenzyme A transporter SLC25A42 [Brachionus plicatilis]
MIKNDSIHDKKINALSTKKKIFTSLIAGSLAGAVAKTTIAPLDRAKINFQVRKAPFSYKALFNFLHNDYSLHGFRNLWRGNTASMVRVMPSAGINFTSHEQYKRILNVDQTNPTPLKRFLAGSLAGATAAFFTYPLDIARARMAVTNKSQFGNLVEIFNETYKLEGIRGFFRGYTVSLLGALPYAGSAYFVYETLKIFHKNKNKKEPAPIERVLYGAIAGAAGQTSSYPFDIIRRRMQTAFILNRHESDLGILELLSKIISEEGYIKGLYKGLSMNWIKGPVAAGVGFMTYDPWVLLFQVNLKYETKNKFINDKILATPLFRNDWTIIKVRNRGGYVARFEVMYKLGDEFKKEETGTFPIGQAKSVLIPPEAISIVIRCENNIFISSWSTIFSYNMAVAKTTCFEISGTTLGPKWSTVEC